MNKKVNRKRKFGGRPPLPVDSVRGHRVVTFLTREENEQLVKMATTQGKSVSLTCHDLLVSGLGLRSL
jgi:hypothetical protein